MGFARPARARRPAYAVGLSLLASLGAAGASAQDAELTARVWLDRGDEPVLEVGDMVRLYYRASRDAFVAIFQIDTNGGVHLVFPRSPDENHFARGGRDFRLLFPRSPYWRVDEDPGVGYYFILASQDPFDLTALPYSHYGRGWDLSRVGRQLYQDPYVAMDDWVATLIPDWEYVPYALDFVTYHVGERYDYPRFLCYDCHGFRPFYAWNPYHYSCTDFRVVIVNDPYYYPVTRYRGSRVVYARPPEPFQPRFAFKERAAGEPAEPLVAPREAVPRRDAAGTAGGAVRRPAAVDGSGGAGGDPRPGGGRATVWPGGTPTRRAVPSSGEERRPSSVVRDPRGTVPTGIQAPSPRLAPGGEPVRPTPEDNRGAEPDRPVLERRPPAVPGGEGSRPGTGPTARPREGSGGSGSAPRPSGSVRPPAADASRGGAPARRPSAAVPRGGDRPAAGSGSARPSSSNPPAGRPPVRRPPPTRPPGGDDAVGARERDPDGAGAGDAVPVGELGRSGPRGVPVADLNRSGASNDGAGRASPSVPSGSVSGARPRPVDRPGAEVPRRAGDERSSPPPADAGRSRVRSVVGGVLGRVRGSAESGVSSQAGSERPSAGRSGERELDRAMVAPSRGSRSSGGAGASAGAGSRAPARVAPSAAAASPDRRSAPRVAPQPERAPERTPDRGNGDAVRGPSRPDAAPARRPGGVRRPPPPPGG